MRARGLVEALDLREQNRVSWSADNQYRGKASGPP